MYLVLFFCFDANIEWIDERIENKVLDRFDDELLFVRRDVVWAGWESFKGVLFLIASVELFFQRGCVL